MECIDLAKLHPEEYRPAKGIRDFQAGEAFFLAVEGRGEPGGEAFQEAIQALFSVAYTARFSLKKRGELDFKVMTLECMWGRFDPHATPREEWRWTLMSRVPEAFTAAHLEEFKREIAARKGLDLSAVARVRLPGGRYLQTLHLGPYADLHSTYALLEEHAARAGLRPGACREVYLSDPRRTAPERLKTLVRMGVE